MRALEILLERLAKSLEDSRALPDEGPPDLAILGPLIEKVPALVTIHTFKEQPCMIYLNEKQREFYGFSQNDVSSMGLSFYLRTFHSTSLPLLAHCYQFFENDPPASLNLTYRLKDASGDFRNVHGSSRALTRNANGIPTYIATITCPRADWLELSTIIRFKLEHLTKRQQDCLRLLLKGATNEKIARQLKVSVKTVENHVSIILKAAGVSSRRDLLCEPGTTS